MSARKIEEIPTRQTLLSRLKDLEDSEGWRVFFDTYRGLIYTTALRSGLTEAESQDVVQETVIAAAKSLPNFHYNPALGSFRSWLLKLTHWRIMDQFRKRRPGWSEEAPGSCSGGDLPALEKIPDPSSSELKNAWEEEWSRNLFYVALERVKRRVNPRHYQIFDLYVLQSWPAHKVSTALNISSKNVYTIKHRIASEIKKETKLLETNPLAPLKFSPSGAPAYPAPSQEKPRAQ